MPTQIELEIACRGPRLTVAEERARDIEWRTPEARERRRKRAQEIEDRRFIVNTEWLAIGPLSPSLSAEL